MAFLAVWLERGSKGEAIESAFHWRHAARWEVSAGLRRQGEKGPGGVLLGRFWPEEFRGEANLGCEFGHDGIGKCWVSVRDLQARIFLKAGG